MGFDDWISALTLAIAVGGLVPIFIIKEDRRRELTIVVMVSLLFALTAIRAVRNYEHVSAVREIQNDIVGTLAGNRWTSDQLYKQLHFPQRDVFFEALTATVDQGRVQQAVVPVRIDDGPPVDVRLYWVQPAKAQAGGTGPSAPCGSLGSYRVPTGLSQGPTIKAAWKLPVGLVYASLFPLPQLLR
jgi:hypothetical protein